MITEEISEGEVYEWMAAQQAAITGMYGETYVCGGIEAVKVRGFHIPDRIITKRKGSGNRIMAIEGEFPDIVSPEDVEIEVSEKMEEGIWKVSVYENDD